MAPFELLLLSALVASSAALPASSPMPSYRGLKTGFSTRSSPATGRHERALSQDSQQTLTSKYQCFGADSSADSLSATHWLSFNELWRINEPTILSKNNGDTYIEHYIKEAIVQVSDESAIDSRLILAMMMQESSGHALIPCKVQSTGGSKCGLMRASNGSAFDGARPQASILQMIRDGVEGDDLDRALDGDERYLSDVANRLLGWCGRGEGFGVCVSEK